MVPTEIGDLPSDLWRLIGEKPPVTKPLESELEKHEQRDQVRRETTSERAIQASQSDISSGDEARRISEDTETEKFISPVISNIDAIQRSTSEEPDQEFIISGSEEIPVGSNRVISYQPANKIPQTTSQAKSSTRSLENNSQVIHPSSGEDLAGLGEPEVRVRIA